jgi:glycerate-2-kinase
MNNLDNPSQLFEIPSKCFDCPAICDIADTLAANQTQKLANEVVATQIVMSDIPEEAVEFVRSTFDVPDKEVKEVFKQFRSILGNKVEESFAEVEKSDAEATTAIQTLVENCEGQLRMRGQTKLGRTVTVTVCGSLLAPLDRTVPEHTHIDRD